MVVTDYNEQFLDKRGTNHLIDELKAYIDGIATGDIDLSNYVTKSELQAKLDALDINIDLSSYATKEELTNAINSIDLSDYATKSEIPSLDGYAKLTDLPTKVSQLENDNNYLTSVPEGYVTETELNAKGYLTEHQDLSDYALKTEIPSLDGLATTEYVDNATAGSADNALIQAKEYTDLKVAGQQGENIFKKQIVESLPIEEIDTNTIYLILKSDANGNDNYNEYINLDGTSDGYEWIGNTFVDLTDYYNKTESNDLFLLKTNLTNNLLATVPGTALDAVQGKELDTRVTTNTNDIDTLNRNLANKIDSIPTMTTTVNGIGKPDNITIGVNNGTFSTKFKNYTSLSGLGLTAPKTCLEIATAMPNGSQIMLQITSRETAVTDTPSNIGKLTIERFNNARCYAYFNEYTGKTYAPRMHVRYIRPLDNAISDWTEYLTTSRLTNNLLATVEGTALDAVQGKALNDKMTTNTTDIAALNQKLPQSNYQIRIGSTEITCAPNATSTLSVSSLILNAFGWTQLYMLVPVLSSSIPSTLFLSYRDGVIYVYNNSAEHHDNVPILYIAIGK